MSILNNNPLVSIIIPIYQVYDYIEYALKSVIKQNYKNIDIILVNDGSTDKSIEIARKYASKDSRIFIINKRNGGLSSARNAGIEFVKNSYLRNYIESIQRDKKNEISFQKIQTKLESLFKTKYDSLITKNKDVHKQNFEERISSFKQIINLNSHLIFKNQYPIFIKEEAFPKIFKREFLNHNKIFLYSKDKILIVDLIKLLNKDAKPLIKVVRDKDIKLINEFIQFNPNIPLTPIFDVSFTKPSMEFLNKITILNHNEIFINEEDLVHHFKSNLPKNQYIHFFDSDDIMEKWCIQRCLEELDEKTEVLLHQHAFIDKSMLFNLYSSYRRYLKKLLIKIINKIRNNYSSNQSGVDIIKHKLNVCSWFNFGWHGIIKTDFLNKIKIRFIFLIEMEDIGFGNVLFFHADFAKIINDKVICYRQRDGSICHFEHNTSNIILPPYLEKFKNNFPNNSSLKKYYVSFSHIFNIFDIYVSLFRNSNFTVFEDNMNSMFNSVKKVYYDKKEYNELIKNNDFCCSEKIINAFFNSLKIE